MNNENTYAQENCGQKILIKSLLIIFITGAFLIGLFTNYKQETLICSKAYNICYIQKINLVNMKTNKTLLKYSDIEKVSYIPQKVKGNRYAKGYTSYLLSFTTKNNNPVIIFSTAYFDKDEIKKAVNEINKQMKNNEGNVKFERE